MLMYTSCGWFFDDISGVEATQVLLARSQTGVAPVHAVWFVSENSRTSSGRSCFCIASSAGPTLFSSTAAWMPNAPVSANVRTKLDTE